MKYNDQLFKSGYEILDLYEHKSLERDTEIQKLKNEFLDIVFIKIAWELKKIELGNKNDKISFTISANDNEDIVIYERLKFIINILTKLDEFDSFLNDYCMRVIYSKDENNSKNFKPDLLINWNYKSYVNGIDNCFNKVLKKEF